MTKLNVIRRTLVKSLDILAFVRQLKMFLEVTLNRVHINVAYLQAGMPQICFAGFIPGPDTIVATSICQIVTNDTH